MVICQSQMAINYITSYLNRWQNTPAIKAAGFDVNRPSNLIYLPIEDGSHTTRSIHNGQNKAHANYNADIKQKLNDIVEFGNAKRWGRQQNLDAIESLREDTRLGLREGEIKCY